MTSRILKATLAASAIVLTSALAPAAAQEPPPGVISLPDLIEGDLDSRGSIGQEAPLSIGSSGNTGLLSTRNPGSSDLANSSGSQSNDGSSASSGSEGSTESLEDSGSAGSLGSLEADLDNTPPQAARWVPDPTTSTWSIPNRVAPAQYSAPNAKEYNFRYGGNLVPPGVNDFDCTPAPGMDPVILVHGTGQNVYTEFATLGPALAEAGYCVFGLNYGTHPNGGPNAWGDATTSARQVGEFVDLVRDHVGAEKVNVIGVSQGTNISRWWVNKEGGAEVTNTWVGISSPTRGSTLWGAVPLTESLGVNGSISEFFEPGLAQQQGNSPWMQELNDPAETVEGPRYVTVSSIVDEVITPFTRQPINGPDVGNYYLQGQCALDWSGHMGLPYSVTTRDIVLAELAGETPDPGCRLAPLSAYQFDNSVVLYS